MPVKTPHIPEGQFAALKAEAIDPGLSEDYVIFGDRRYQVRLLPLKGERRVVALLAPHMGLIGDLSSLGEDLAGFAEFAIKAGEILPQVLGLVFESQGIDAEWLENHATGRQMVRALMAQLRKNELSDLLGKLSSRGDP